MSLDGWLFSVSPLFRDEIVAIYFSKIPLEESVPGRGWFGEGRGQQRCMKLVSYHVRTCGLLEFYCCFVCFWFSTIDFW